MKMRDETNKMVVERLAERGAETRIYDATDIDPHGNTLPITLQALTKTKRYRKLAFPETLTLCTGARVMVLRNLHTKQGWVNGTMCEVETCTPDVIFIRNLYTSERRPIFRENQRIRLPSANFYIRQQQFPLMLAFAVTIHKTQVLSQGAGFWCVVFGVFGHIDDTLH